MDSSEPSNSGTISYEKPYVPKNVKATCGFKDTITLSWDPVENASMYIIEGIEASRFGSAKMEEYGTTSSTSITFNLNGSGNGAYRVFDANQSYIFSVRAYINYGSSTDYLISDNSNYVEGCFAPETVQFHITVTNTSIRAYWNCSNLFSTLNNEKEPVQLYTPEFTLLYQKQGENSWHEIKASDDIDAQTLWLFTNLDVRKWGFEHSQEYVFMLRMNVKDTDALPVTSESISLRIDDSLDVSSVNNLTATDGTYSDKVVLTWDIPSWSLPANRSNSYFKIQRAQSGSDTWITLVDEIAEKDNINTTITPNGSSSITESITYEDKSAAPGVQYIYRVINGAIDTDNLIHNQEDNDAATANGRIFYPAPVEVSGEWAIDSSSHLKGTSTLSWGSLMTQIPSDLSYKIEKSVWHGKIDKTTKEFIDISPDEVSSGTKTISESVESLCTECSAEGTIHKYNYRLVITRGNSVVYELGIFFSDENRPTIGSVIENQIFTDFCVTNNGLNDYINAIRIEWKESTELSEADISYSYAIKNVGDKEYSSYRSLNPEYDSASGLMYFVINNINDSNEKQIKLSASYSVGDETITYPTAEDDIFVTGKRFDLSDIAITASDGTYNDRISIGWDEIAVSSENIVFSVEMDNSAIDTINPINNTYEILDTNSHVTAGEDYSFSISAYNMNQSGTPKTYTKSDSGYILPIPKISNVTKAAYDDQIIVEWNDCGEKVDGYNIYVYDSRSMSESIHRETIEDANSFILSNDMLTLEAGVDYYFAVSGIKKNNTDTVVESKFYDRQDYFDELVENYPYGSDPINVGYIFDGYFTADQIEITELVNGDYIADYFQIKIPVNKTIRSITISSTSGEDKSYKTSDARTSSGNAVDDFWIINEGTEAEPAWFAYINSQIGVVEIVNNNSIRVPVVYVQSFGPADNTSTELFTMNENGGYRRGLTNYDYIRLFNIAFREGVNSCRSEDVEWWDPYTEDRKYNSDKTVYTGISYSEWDLVNYHNPGFIQFINYKQSNLYSLNSTDGWNGRLLTYPYKGSGIGSNNKLESVETSNIAYPTQMKFYSISIFGETVNYKDVNIVINTLNVKNGDSNEGVGIYTVNDSTIEITKDIFDKYIKEKP